MDHTFCFNTSSSHADNADEAMALLKSAISGITSVSKEIRGSVRIIYDSANLGSFLTIELSPNFSFRNALDRMQEEAERDLAELILELFDKGPALNLLQDEELEELAETSFFYPDTPYGTSDDCLAIAWHFDAILLSLDTEPRWSSNFVEFCFLDSQGALQSHTLPNVSRLVHAAHHFHVDEPIGLSVLRAELDTCVFSEAFIDWFDSLDNKNSARVSKKLIHAKRMGFDGKEPLFKSLGGDGGLWEIRFSFFPGGAVRIIYKPQAERKFALLSGWVKKSNREGYKQQIKIAGEQLARGRLT